MKNLNAAELNILIERIWHTGKRNHLECLARSCKDLCDLIFRVDNHLSLMILARQAWYEGYLAGYVLTEMESAYSDYTKYRERVEDAVDAADLNKAQAVAMVGKWYDKTLVAMQDIWFNNLTDWQPD